MREETKNRILAAMAGTGAAAGGFAGIHGINLIPENVKNEALRKLIEDRPLIITTTMAPELVTGSGEARMAHNMVRLLRNNGINARIGITGGGEPIPEALKNTSDHAKMSYPYLSSPAYRDSFRHSSFPWYMPTNILYPGSNINHKNLEALNKMKVPDGRAGDALLKRMLEASGTEGKEWVASHSGDMKSMEKTFSDLLSGRRAGLGIKDFDDALGKLRSGEWDKFSPGRLSTILKLKNNLSPILSDGADMYMTPGEVISHIGSGRAAGVLSTERGFDWASAGNLTNGRSLKSSLIGALEKLPISNESKESVIRSLAKMIYGPEADAIKDISKIIDGQTLERLSSNGNILGSIVRDASTAHMLSDSIGSNSGVKNLGLLYNFKANYTSPYDNWIPGAEVPMPPERIEEVLNARSASRANMFKEVNRIRAAAGLPALSDSTKMVFMSGGSVGPNGTQKLIDMLNATEGMNDVHVFSQIGGNQKFLDMVQNNSAYQNAIRGKSAGEIEKYKEAVRAQGGYISDLEREYAELARKYPGRFTLTSRIPGNVLKDSIAGANLYVPYGGSSTAQEATAFLTPQAFSTDDMLNKGNLDYVIGKRNVPELMTKLDNTSTGVARHVGYNPEGTKLFSSGNGLDGNFRGHLSSKYRLGIFGEEKSLSELTAAATRANTSNREIVRRLLSDETQRRAFTQENLDSVRRLVKSQHDATNRFVELARSLMDGENIVTRTDKGLKFGLGPKGIVNGLKGTYLRLGRALSHGPVGARLAPALLGLGAIGGGTGAYFAGKKLLGD